jgi:hypothetical protein
MRPIGTHVAQTFCPTASLDIVSSILWHDSDQPNRLTLKPIANKLAYANPCSMLQRSKNYTKGGIIVQVAASQLTSSKLCMTSNPIDEKPSKLPSPSICTC